MAHCIMTDFTDPINVGSCRGSINPLELIVWPGWKRHFGVIVTYVWKSKARTTLSVPFKDDKNYTFVTIARLLNEQLNISTAGDPVVVFVIVQQTLKSNIHLSIFAFFQEDLQVTI